MLQRKGITPVIAIVLMLLITIGAVGLVATQFRGIITGSDTSEKLSSQEKVRNTKISFSSVYNNDTDKNGGDAADTVNITVRNTGSVAVNMSSDLSIQYVPDGSSGSGLPFTTYPDTTMSETECFDTHGGEERLDPKDSYTCKTGIKFPEPNENIEIQISMNGADKSWTYTCSSPTSDSVTC